MKDTPQAGWLISEWVQQARIARATFYNLPEQYKPASVKVGKRVIIREAPADWLLRMAEAGGVPSKVPPDVPRREPR
jgi:hypothetical protein